MKGLLVFELHTGNKPEQSYVLTGEVNGRQIAPVFEPSEKSPELKLCRKDFGGEYLYCVPVEDVGKGCVCATGDFVKTSDSRFPNRYPLPIHRNQPHLFS